MAISTLELELSNLERGKEIHVNIFSISDSEASREIQYIDCLPLSCNVKECLNFPPCTKREEDA
jgi:hypothetical protein